MPPVWNCDGLVCRLTMFTPWTMTRFSSRSTFRTSPCLPLSRPVVTITRSPFLIFSFVAISQHLGRQADDLHEFPAAQLARHRTEDAGADRLALLVDQHRGVLIELDRGAVGPVQLLGRADDDGAMDVALLHAAARDRL